MIAEGVWDRDEHERRMVDPDLYRPACRWCGRPMQGHGYRERRLVHEVPIDIRRYRCCLCHAVVQVLPGFVARNLWRTWLTVEAVVVSPTRRQRVVAARTARRWRERAAQEARRILHVLSSLRTPVLDDLVAGLGLDAARRALLAAYRPLAGVPGALAALTVLLGKVLPGLRVM